MGYLLVAGKVLSSIQFNLLSWRISIKVSYKMNAYISILKVSFKINAYINIIFFSKKTLVLKIVMVHFISANSPLTP